MNAEDKLIEYVKNTPINSNPNVLHSLINNIKKEVGPAEEEVILFLRDVTDTGKVTCNRTYDEVMDIIKSHKPFQAVIASKEEDYEIGYYRPMPYRGQEGEYLFFGYDYGDTFDENDIPKLFYEDPLFGYHIIKEVVCWASDSEIYFITTRIIPDPTPQ